MHHIFSSIYNTKYERNEGVNTLMKLKKGENDLCTKRPDLVKEWDQDKNELDPHNVTEGSNKKVWWKCENGHEWEASVNSRTHGTGCPVCAGKKIVPEKNDFATLYPELAKEWHPTENRDIDCKNISRGSGKKVWWKCENGHEWEATVLSRKNGHGCPYCAGKAVKVGCNDLATTNPDLAKEWDIKRNGDLTPKDVTAGSNKKVWWKCDKGHEWRASVNNRNRGSKCPYCDKKGHKIIEK